MKKKKIPLKMMIKNKNYCFKTRKKKENHFLLRVQLLKNLLQVNHHLHLLQANLYHKNHNHSKVVYINNLNRNFMNRKTIYKKLKVKMIMIKKN